MKRRVHLFFLYTLLSAVFLSAQEDISQKYYFKTLDIADGLSQNTVNCILQDKMGFMWFGTKDGLNRYDGLSFTVFKQETGNDKSLGSNYITTLYEDNNKKLWVGTTDGLYIYHLEEERFEHLLVKTARGESIYKPINGILPSREGVFWITTEGQGVFCYDEQRNILTQHIVATGENEACNIRHLNIDASGNIWFVVGTKGLFFSEDGQTFQALNNEEGENLLADFSVFAMLLEKNKLFVLSNNKGLVELNIKSRKWKQLFVSDKENTKIFMRSCIKTANGEFWIGSESGIYIYKPDNDQYIHLKHSANDPYSLADNAIHSIYQDREGSVWIGSYFGGINYYPRQYSYFEKYYPLGEEGGLSGKRVRVMCEEENGRIWIGTEDGGLNLFDPKTKKTRAIAKDILYHNIHGLCIDGEYLWVGTYSKGLYKLHLKTLAIKDYSTDRNKYRLHSNIIYVIFKDRTGLVWVGTGEGLYTYHRESDTFSFVPELSKNLIRDIKEDKEGNICCSTTINGLFFLNRKDGRWQNYTHQPDEPNSLPQNNVLSIFVDSKKQVWVTTQGAGFGRFLPDEGKFICYNSSDGLPNDVVYQLLEDDNGYFWISTNNGLSCFDPEQKRFSNYYVADGLPTKQFNYHSGLKSSDGMLYFGSIKGFIAFNPNQFHQNEYIPPVALTDFLLFNKKVKVGEKSSPLSKSITYSDKIRLSHKENSFLIKFAALSYYASEKNQYLYRLEGFDKEWFSGNETHSANYSNIKHGKYTFRLKASNPSGIWNDEILELPIEITPPWWLSLTAYIFYGIAFILFIGFVSLFIKRKNRLKEKRRQERFEQEKEREIYAAKIDFFTNVAHEIRTPLSLIKSPLENIIKHREVENEVKEDLEIIDRNTNRLLDLTNQLLDFRKIESQSLALNYMHCNVSVVLNDLYFRFNLSARQRKLDFSLSLPETDFFAPLDREAVIKIVSNLFSNAIKNAHSYIQVHLLAESHEDPDFFDLLVENDGNIVPIAQREAIFKPFVQYLQKGEDIKTGTGLGLALARSLAELHGGSLSMDQDETCNRFILTLPTRQEHVLGLREKEKEEEVREKDLMEPNKRKATLLIVEDDKELAAYISKILAPQYNLLVAFDGKMALQELDKHYVNLILSDVMMPEMDGFELCKKIKSDITTSHIPVVLLTAKTDLQAKIEGIELGADAYIEKPFSNDYLLASISTLLINREKIMESFKNVPLLSESSQISKADETFITLLNEIIQKNMSNPDFNQDLFASALHMSKSSLYRKIKGVFGMSPNDLIRLERLKKAAQLFQEGNDRVTEVCYLVGFNSPSYFTKCFLKQFGTHPKHFKH